MFALLYSSCASSACETPPIFESISPGFDTVEQGALQLATSVLIPLPKNLLEGCCGLKAK